MKKYLLLAAFLIAACNSSTELREGRWSGHLSPMNHPDMTIPVSYNVAYSLNKLDITIIGSNGAPVKARNPHIKEDTLYFAFNEPEEQVLLECALARQNSSEFSGKCVDSSGKWAQFTMAAPE